MNFWIPVVISCLRYYVFIIKVSDHSKFICTWHTGSYIYRVLWLTICHYKLNNIHIFIYTHISPRNENLILLVQIRLLKLFLYTFVVLNKNWKMYWSEQSFTGFRPEDRCSLWGLHIFCQHNSMKITQKKARAISSDLSIVSSTPFI